MSDADTTSSEATDGAAEAPRLPLFYKELAVLRADQHGALGLEQDNDFSFASAAMAVPVCTAEYAATSRQYPIVFTGGDGRPASLAVMGLRQDQNVFVDSKGTWSPEHYIPAYVRRYPFMLVATAPDSKQLTLCVDPTSKRLVEGGAQKLFDGQEAGEAGQEALKFAMEFQARMRDTDTFIGVLLEHDLLVSNQGRFTMPSGEALTVADFRIVDEKKLNDLSDDAVLALRKVGALGPIYCHLVSMGSWQNVVMHASRMA